MSLRIAGHMPELYGRDPKPIGRKARIPDRTHRPDMPSRVESRAGRTSPTRAIEREVGRNKGAIEYELECGHHVLRWSATRDDVPCRACAREAAGG